MEWVETLQSESFARTLRFVLAAASIPAVAVCWGASRTNNKTWRQFSVTVLTLLAVLAAAAFVRFGAYPWVGGCNSHEVFHYYLGPKYQAEVGYEHLYACAVIADWESEQLFRKVQYVRDVNTQRQFPRQQVLADAAACVGRFSASRWREFKADVTAIVETNKLRGHLVTDLGYVASPFWTFWATPVMHGIGADSREALAILCSMDYLLFLMALALIWRAYGWTAAMVCASFVFTSFAIDTWTIRGSILRFDWLVALIAAVCCLHLGYFKTAGCLAAVSILIRGFPVLFFAGMGFQLLADLIRRRSVHREHAAFFTSMIVGGALLAAPSALRPGGVDQWREFITRMAQHSELVRVGRVGFTAASTYGGERSRNDFVSAKRVGSREAWSAEKQQKLSTVRPWLRVVSLLVLAIIGGLSLRLTPELTAGLGVLALYFTVDVSWYYYVILWVPCLIFAGRMYHWAGALAVMILSAGNLISLWIDSAIGFEVRRYAFVSWLMLAVLLAASVLLWWLRERNAPESLVVENAA